MGELQLIGVTIQGPGLPGHESVIQSVKVTSRRATRPGIAFRIGMVAGATEEDLRALIMHSPGVSGTVQMHAHVATLDLSGRLVQAAVTDLAATGRYDILVEFAQQIKKRLTVLQRAMQAM